MTTSRAAAAAGAGLNSLLTATAGGGGAMSGGAGGITIGGGGVVPAGVPAYPQYTQTMSRSSRSLAQFGQICIRTGWGKHHAAPTRPLIRRYFSNWLVAAALRAPYGRTGLKVRSPVRDA